MKKENIRNWKLRELIDQVEVYRDDSIEFLDSLFTEFNLPKSKEVLVNKSSTMIDWTRMPQHHVFFLDVEGNEIEIQLALSKSKLLSKKRLIISYGKNEPAILMPSSIFIQDWEDILASTCWETIIISEDFELTMEVTRDYFMHSDFFIKS